MAKNKEPKENILYKILKALKLEGTTTFGRINLASVVVLIFFCLWYTASDGLAFLISSISDTVKTVFLKQDIYHPYESDNLLKVIVPVAILIISCLLLVYKYDSKKEKDNQTNNMN